MRWGWEDSLSPLSDMAVPKHLRAAEPIPRS